MGNTVPLPRYGCCVPRSSYVNNYDNNGNAPRVKVCHRRNISATFHVSDGTGASGPVQLNVNTASEEELMTLPGINRDTARNIVDYRRQIGRFKKVEDVALVSGVGATKLHLIRPEICVSERASTASSLSSSQVDVTSTVAPTVGVPGDSDSRLSSRSGNGGCVASININQANVFQLMKVRGGLVTQQLAENIVAHRDRKGSYKSLDDLLKVKGISEPMINSLRAYLTVGDDNHVPVAGVGSDGGDGLLDSNAVGVSGLQSEQLSSLLNVVKLLGKSEEDIMFHIGPLAHQSFRRGRHAARESSVTSYPSWARQVAERVLRVASWNVEQCTADKASNPGVREVLAMTLLENRIDIVALQEVNAAALSKFCDELNHPTIPNVRKWSKMDSSLCWAQIASADEDNLALAFLFRSDRLSDVQQHVFRSDTVDCFFIKFKVHSTEHVTCVNVHCKSPSASSEQDLTSLLKQLSEFAGQSMVVFTGDFPTNSRLAGIMQDNRMRSVLADNMFTDISCDVPEGSVNNVSLLFSEQGSNWTLSDNEIVREGLTSPWIPNGWGWGGLASHYCPVWAEFTHNAPLADNVLSTINGGGRKRPNGVAGHRP